MSIHAEQPEQQATKTAAKIPDTSHSVYEVDFYAWTQHQSALLRERRFSELDIANLVEEIESLGRSEKRELESRLKILLTHFLKWQFQADQHKRHGRSWLATIRNQRSELRKLIRDNPSLKASLDPIFAEAYQDARYETEAETGLPISAFPESPPYVINQVLDATWMPDV